MVPCHTFRVSHSRGCRRRSCHNAEVHMLRLKRGVPPLTRCSLGSELPPMFPLSPNLGSPGGHLRVSWSALHCMQATAGAQRQERQQLHPPLLIPRNVFFNCLQISLLFLHPSLFILTTDTQTHPSQSPPLASLTPPTASPLSISSQQSWLSRTVRA